MASAYTTNCKRDRQESHTYSISIISFSRVIHDYVGKLAKKRNCLNSPPETFPWNNTTLAEREGNEEKAIFLRTGHIKFSNK